MGKRITSVLLAALIALLCGGCGGEESSSQSKNESDKNSITESDSSNNNDSVNADSSKVSMSENESSSDKLTESLDNESYKEKTNSSVNESETDNTYGQIGQKEYVPNYYIYAETGAVIIESDTKTGDFSWQGKCESCGKVDSNIQRATMSGNGAKRTYSFRCMNHDCEMFTKSQQVVICCTDNGEWTEIT